MFKNKMHKFSEQTALIRVASYTQIAQALSSFVLPAL